MEFAVRHHKGCGGWWPSRSLVLEQYSQSTWKHSGCPHVSPSSAAIGLNALISASRGKRPDAARDHRLRSLIEWRRPGTQALTAETAVPVRSIAATGSAPARVAAPGLNSADSATRRRAQYDKLPHKFRSRLSTRGGMNAILLRREALWPTSCTPTGSEPRKT